MHFISERQGKGMDVNILEQYVERVYGWAVKQTYSVEEAEELSQEILFTAVREFAKLKNQERFEPWLWGVASNVKKTFRRRLGKQRAMYSYDVPLDLPCEEADEGEEELYAFLRQKIVMFSAMYRDIVILFYYDGLSTKQIAEKLKIPEGTVTWRLSRAREKLKKECEKKECMDMEEAALRPVRMEIGMYGEGNYDGDKIPFPSAYIADALSQNILFHCYEKPRDVEEISKLTGVPAYYIEENIKNLLKREALISLPKEKYQTDFVIWTDAFGNYCKENAEAALLPVMDRMLAAFKEIAEEAGKIGFYKAGKSETEFFTCMPLWQWSRKRENIVSFRIRKLRKNMMVPIGVILRQWKPARIPALGLVFNGVATWAVEGAIPIPFTSLLGFAIGG